MAEKEWQDYKEEFDNLTCKLCKRNFGHIAVAFRTPDELKHAHTTAHLQDLVRDMKKVCERVAKVGWVEREHVDLAQDVMLRSEVIDGGLF